MSNDPYEVLGVPRNASQKEIKSAYRRLAFRYHPDQNPDDEESEEAFKRVSWAYDILSDPVQRRRYDRGGLDATAEGVRPGDFSLRRGMEAFSEFIEMFGALFSGRRPEEGPRPIEGEDLYATVDLTLEEVIRGVEKSVEVPSVRICSECRGTGAAHGAKMSTCPACEGRGESRSGLFGLMDVCERCHGTGQVPSKSCENCDGDGRIRGRRTVEIEIPAGVRSEQTLRRKGEGAPGWFGGEPGDLMVEVRQKPHPDFERRGNDVYADASVSFTKASLGGDKRIATLEGDVMMTIPAGTTSGDVFRLGGRGFPDVRSGERGDQYVRVVVETPVDLTDRQRDKARQRREAGGNPDVGERSIGERLRQLFSGSS